MKIQIRWNLFHWIAWNFEDLETEVNSSSPIIKCLGADFTDEREPTHSILEENDWKLKEN